MAEKNLASIAKKTGTSSKKTSTRTAPKKTATTRKTTTSKPVEKKLTAAQERDLKAKQKVQELLKDTDLTMKREELLELDEGGEEKGFEWLEEQVGLQAQKIEKLREELSASKADYNKLLDAHQALKAGKNVVDDSDMKKNVVKVFNELQENYIRMGKNPNGASNFRIVPVAFMNRLIMFFPFLKDLKKY